MEGRMRRLVLAMVMGTVLPIDATAQSRQSTDVTTLAYARLGLGAVAGEQLRRAPAFGFGIRGEGDRYAVDASFFNFTADDPYSGAEMAAGSLLKLEGLRYLSPGMGGSPYLGAGLSWGWASIGRTVSDPSLYASGWHGSGLQAELTSGYEVGRTSDLRLFVQADASLPIFQVASQTYSYAQPGIQTLTAVDSRYVPTLVVSMGVAWRTHH